MDHEKAHHTGNGHPSGAAHAKPPHANFLEEEKVGEQKGTHHQVGGQNVKPFPKGGRLQGHEEHGGEGALPVKVSFCRFPGGSHKHIPQGSASSYRLGYIKTVIVVVGTGVIVNGDSAQGEQGKSQHHCAEKSDPGFGEKAVDPFPDLFSHREDSFLRPWPARGWLLKA